MAATFRTDLFTRRKNLILSATLGISLSAGLSGCMLDRVLEVRSQFCDFEQNFDIEFDQQPGVVMTHPVLLDRDVLWLIGAEPTEITTLPGSKTMTWVIEEAIADPDPAYDLRFDLEFQYVDEEYRLSQIRLDPKFNALLNPDKLDHETLLASAQDICETGLSFRMRSMEFDIPEEDLEQLPSRPEVLKLAGPPHGLTAPGGGWTWRYRPRGASDESNTAQFTVWFDEISLEPLRMESEYGRYRSQADFSAKKLSMNVKL
jgi:hypothetical protein